MNDICIFLYVWQAAPDVKALESKDDKDFELSADEEEELGMSYNYMDVCFTGHTVIHACFKNAVSIAWWFILICLCWDSIGIHPLSQ